ncbi:hypothetical protein [Kutzneria sp. 744]|uniref:hypothetical protein n=1 Tax=Kutzneria sp. (strain 744) TaxID=345341 RepID=UPI0003EED7A8|nr:hypothetical protein [Kutzneria sp. 744]EWM15277.1 hypothetical protein KUTG_05581 [Kutzneria sp. 744]
MLDTGVFPGGPEPMLWRPDLDQPRLRREAVMESVLPEAAPFALIGTAIAFMTGSWIGVLVALLVLALAGLAAVSAYRCWGLDCSRPGWTRHRRDRGAGEWFYRPSDFTALSKDCRDQVDNVFAALGVFDDPLVLAWLDPADRREVHVVAWQLLDCLHATLPARTLLGRVMPDLADDGVVTLARYELVRLDTEISVGVEAFCDTSALVRELAVRITAPRRRVALHAGLRCLRLPTVPAVAELREDVRSRVRAVQQVLDLAGTTP